MTDTTYNGWSNYETWCCNLWLTNDQGTYNYWREQAADRIQQAWYKSDPHFTLAELSRITLAEQLKEEVTAGADATLREANLYSDLLGAALSSVNWHEIADSFLVDLTPTLDIDL